MASPCRQHEHEEYIQSVFDKVIESGYYPDKAPSGPWAFMCMSLERAEIAGVIDRREHFAARDAIHLYMGNRATMRNFLCMNGVYRDPVDIYKNWSNRPRVEEIVS